ncbi:MND1-interacting protein 1-like [Nymphaea colorata]|nr:MND1-interacting protein 1-like [Nymphaea colorata]XP_031483752.1 MND1-interacting protein 1-like [Nymphaea colorata]
MASVGEETMGDGRKANPDIGVMNEGDVNVLEEPCPAVIEFLDVGDCGKCSSDCREMDGSEWGLCTEKQLEELLLKNLEFLYNEAICKIVSLGYDEDVALKAVLRNGHCYGSGDVLSNIIHNALAYLTSDANGGLDESGFVFGELKQLEEYSLAGIVCLLQQVRPQLSKGDAMWCLLMSDLHVGRASALEFPLTSTEKDGVRNETEEGSPLPSPGGVSVPVPIRPPLNLVPGAESSETCKSYGGLGFRGEGLTMSGITNVTDPTNLVPTTVNVDGDLSNLNETPVGVSMLRRNAAAVFPTRFPEVLKADGCNPLSSSAGCYHDHPSLTLCMHHHKGKSELGGLSLLKNQADMVHGSTGAAHLVTVSARSELPSGIDSVSKVSPENCENSKETDNPDIVSSIASNLENMHISDKLDGTSDQRDEMISKLTHQIGMLERQLQERMEWAQKKALQAAKKLSSDLTELKMLRMEREETLHQKNKQSLEDATMKKLSDLEAALKKAGAQVDRANAAVKHLETENAEIRAEMVAAKLSAAESVKTCLEVEKREKKIQKKLSAWEKQKTKLQEEVAEEKRKNNQLQQQLHLVKEAQKEAEIKWKHELEAKEKAISQVEEERRAKEGTQVNITRRQEALRRKIEIDFQRHKDDIQRLEEEYLRLKASSRSTQLNCSSTTQSTCDVDMAKKVKESHKKATNELDKTQESSCRENKCGRECVFCMREEVSIVFLPCAHQVLCVGCNEAHEKQPKKRCPSCDTGIEQRIRVYGVSS